MVASVSAVRHQTVAPRETDLLKVKVTENDPQFKYCGPVAIDKLPK